MSTGKWPYLASFALFGALLLIVGKTTPAIASIDFQPVSPDELKMTNEPKAPGAPAIILFREVDRDDNGQYGSKEDTYIRIKILTEEGRKVCGHRNSAFKRCREYY